MDNKKEYTWINIYVNHHDRNHVWAMVYSREKRRTKNVSKREIVEFKSYDEMIAFVTNHFGSYELENYVPYSQKKVHINFVDYLQANSIKHKLNPDTDQINLVVRAYYGNGTYRNQDLFFEPRYQNFVMNLLRKSYNLSKNDKLGPEVFREIDADAVYGVENNSKPRVSRTERRIERERHAFPMPEKKKRHPVKNLVIYGTVLVSIFLAAKGISLQIEHADLSDGIALDKITDYGDFKLLLSKGDMGRIAESLIREEYQNISVDDVKNIDEYINTLVKSNHKEESTFHDFQLKEFKYDVGMDAKNTKLLDRLDALYQKCFHKERGSNKYVFNEKEGKKFLDFALPLIIMNNGYYAGYNEWSTDPLSSYANAEEISAYGTLPDFIHEVVNLKVMGVLEHINDYYFGYSNYVTGNRDKATLLSQVMKISDKDISTLIKLVANTKEETHTNGRK
jgi:hypothetical protein